jgi:hypothetical protein
MKKKVETFIHESVGISLGAFTLAVQLGVKV